MKRLNLILSTAVASLVFLLSTGKVAAQQGPGGGGMPAGGMNFDPQQMQQQIQQRMNEFLRERLSVTNDEEWKVIETRLSKVTQLRMEMLMGGGGLAGAFRGMGGGRGGGRALGAFGQASPEGDALQTAIDNNSPDPELQARLQKFRDARKKKQADLTKAQNDLRIVLSLRQEAVLVSMGILE